MKRRTPLKWDLACAACYWTCAAVWLCHALLRRSGSSLFLGLVWLTGAAFMTARTVRRSRRR